jgi:hypothetical protein
LWKPSIKEVSPWTSAVFLVVLATLLLTLFFFGSIVFPVYAGHMTGWEALTEFRGMVRQVLPVLGAALVAYYLSQSNGDE